VSHGPSHRSELRKPAPITVINVKGKQSAMVVLPSSTEQTVTASLHRLDGHAIPAAQVRDSLADIDDFAAKLVALMTGFFTPVSG